MCEGRKEGRKRGNMREGEKGQTCVRLRCVYLGVDVAGVCRGRVCHACS